MQIANVRKSHRKKIDLPPQDDAKSGRKTCKRRQCDLNRRTSVPTPTAENAIEEKRANRVVTEESDEKNRQVKKVAMDILQDDRESGFA